jgi:hypothetical protein
MNSGGISTIDKHIYSGTLNLCLSRNLCYVSLELLCWYILVFLFQCHLLIFSIFLWRIFPFFFMFPFYHLSILFHLSCFFIEDYIEECVLETSRVYILLFVIQNRTRENIVGSIIKNRWYYLIECHELLVIYAIQIRYIWLEHWLSSLQRYTYFQYGSVEFYMVYFQCNLDVNHHFSHFH